MSVVLDIVIAGIIILCFFAGYRKGLVKTVMGLVSFAAAFIMAKTFSPQLSGFIYSRWAHPVLASSAAERIENFLSPSVTLDAIVSDVSPPGNFIDLINGYGFGIPDVKAWLGEAASRGAGKLSEYAASYLVAPVAKGISDFTAFALVLAVSLILVRIVTGIINNIVKLPGLNFANKAGGAIAGGLYGAAVSFIFAILAYYILPYLAANTSLVPGGSVSEVIDGTVLFKLLLNALPLNLA
ncbi:MAG: CvpA family protein [Oscillospiraceae bacterium]|nr:CvpA family protein [Oscillospiraceae bacterium]